MLECSLYILKNEAAGDIFMFSPLCSLTVTKTTTIRFKISIKI